MALPLAGIFSAVTGNDAAGTLLYGLAWYAASLIVLVRTVQAAQVAGAGKNCYWDRVIWGRILLVLCVIFELARRSVLRNIYRQLAHLSARAISGSLGTQATSVVSAKAYHSRTVGSRSGGLSAHTNESISFESCEVDPRSRLPFYSPHHSDLSGQPSYSPARGRAIEVNAIA